MKRIILIAGLLFSLMISSFSLGGISQRLNLHASAVSVKLVLGKDAVLTGYTGEDDNTIFHENVVTFVGEAGSDLPTPTKTGTTFVSWVYAQSSQLIRVSKVPYTSGSILFAYWVGDGSLATSIPSSSSSSSSISSSSISSSVVSSSTPVGEVTFYLNTGGDVLWNTGGAVFFIYTYSSETSGAWPGTQMTMLSGDIFSITVPSGFTNLIFSRWSSAGGSLWNQTGNLTYSAGSNLYSMTGWSTGSWSTYSA